VRRRFGVDEFETVPVPAPSLNDIRLPAPRLAPPELLAPSCATAFYDRAAHSYGKGAVRLSCGNSG